MDRDRAASLLDDLLTSDEMDLTSDLIDEAGGRDAVLAAALSQ